MDIIERLQKFKSIISLLIISLDSLFQEIEDPHLEAVTSKHSSFNNLEKISEEEESSNSMSEKEKINKINIERKITSKSKSQVISSPQIQIKASRFSSKSSSSSSSSSNGSSHDIYGQSSSSSSSNSRVKRTQGMMIKIKQFSGKSINKMSSKSSSMMSKSSKSSRGKVKVIQKQTSHQKVHEKKGTQQF